MVSVNGHTHKTSLRVGLCDSVGSEKPCNCSRSRSRQLAVIVSVSKCSRSQQLAVIMSVSECSRSQQLAVIMSVSKCSWTTACTYTAEVQKDAECMSLLECSKFTFLMTLLMLKLCKGSDPEVTCNETYWWLDGWLAVSFLSLLPHSTHFTNS